VDWGWGMRAMLTIVCLSSMAVASYAQSQGEFHTQPSQVKRTVDALVGHWSFKGSDAEPGVKEPLNVSMEMSESCFRCRCLIKRPHSRLQHPDMHTI
jgi:hypothetical protein